MGYIEIHEIRQTAQRTMTDRKRTSMVFTRRRQNSQRRSVVGKIVSRRSSALPCPSPAIRRDSYVICFDGDFQNLGTLDAKTVEDKFGYKNVPIGARLEIDATDLPQSPVLNKQNGVSQGLVPLPPQTAPTPETSSYIPTKRSSCRSKEPTS